MGLFGLVSLNIARRMKEFSIHKVLGASLGAVIRLVNKEFVRLLIIAIVISTPLSYWLMKSLLDSIYEYHVPVGGLPFVFAAICLLTIAVLTVSSHVYKVVVANPVDSLRTE